MAESSETSRARQIASAFALVLGGAATYIAASSPVAWGMVLGSGVSLGGDVGSQWLMNVTEGLVAAGVILGGRLLDKGRFTLTGIIGIAALLIGVLIGWRSTTTVGALLFGLGGIASLGAGMLMALAVVLVATNAGRRVGVMLGLAYSLGLVGVELIWGSASMLALSRGASWVLSQVAWIGPLSGVVGVVLLLLGRQRDSSDARRGGSRFPLWGPKRATRSTLGTESPSFILLLCLALLASFVGLMSQKAGAALSLIGLPEGSFASGVLVGFTFALARAAGALIGGVLHDLLGAKASAAMAGFGLALTLVVLSFFTGYENPWRFIIGAIGVACGLGLTIAPAVAVHLFGRGHFGHHFGFLFLAIALGNVLLLPLTELVNDHPRIALIVTAILCALVGGVSLKMKQPDDQPSPEDHRAAEA